MNNKIKFFNIDGEWAEGFEANMTNAFKDIFGETFKNVIWKSNDFAPIEAIEYTVNELENSEQTEDCIIFSEGDIIILETTDGSKIELFLSNSNSSTLLNIKKGNQNTIL